MEADPKLIASVLDLFTALDDMPSPSANTTIADVPKPTLERIAQAHQAVADAISAATGLPSPVLAYALLRAMQMASVAGVSHSNKSAQSVIAVTTRIAARLANEQSSAPPN